MKFLLMSDLCKLNIIKNNIYNVLVAKTKGIKENLWMISCLLGVIFCVYCPHCTPKRKIMVNVSIWVNVHFIPAEYHEKNKAITREETKQIWKSYSLPVLQKLFIWWVGIELGRIPLSRICYIVAKEIINSTFYLLLLFTFIHKYI